MTRVTTRNLVAPCASNRHGSTNPAKFGSIVRVPDPCSMFLGELGAESSRLNGSVLEGTPRCASAPHGPPGGPSLQPPVIERCAGESASQTSKNTHENQVPQGTVRVVHAPDNAASATLTLTFASAANAASQHLRHRTFVWSRSAVARRRARLDAQQRHIDRHHSGLPLAVDQAVHMHRRVRPAHAHHDPDKLCRRMILPRHPIARAHHDPELRTPRGSRE